MLVVQGSSETGLFRHLSNHVFGKSEVKKYIVYEGHLFFHNLKNAKKKSHKLFFVCEIIATENVAISCL